MAHLLPCRLLVLLLTCLNSDTWKNSVITLKFEQGGFTIKQCIQKVQTKWAASWQNQQNGLCAQRILRSAWASTSLIRVFAVRMKKAWVLSYPLSAQQRLGSDWANAQADLSLRWAHMPFCWFCHEAAQMANTVDPDQTAPRSGSTLFAKTHPKT